MQFDNSWTAVFKPDRARRYFAFDTRARIDAGSRDYSPVNALWLAELSRLIYRREESELGRPVEGPSRSEVLSRVGLEELRFLDRGSTQCAVIRPLAEHEERYTLVVFRGTLGWHDWLSNLNLLSVPAPRAGRASRGFSSSLDSVWAELEAILAPIEAPVLFTGHSLGGALATLAAARRPARALYTFGCPRVGNAAFARALENEATYRLVNNLDLAPRVPPGFLGAGRAVHSGRCYRIGPDSSVRPEDGERRFDPGRRRSTDDARSPLGPPRCLADHAPVNYVAHLVRAVSSLC